MLCFCAIEGVQDRFRIRYRDLKDAVVPFDGVPFIIKSRYERDCMFGKDKHRATKDRLLAARHEQAQVLNSNNSAEFYISWR